MSYFSTLRFAKKSWTQNQIGSIINKEIKAAEREYGSYTTMIDAEIRANKQGKLFIRPK